MFLRLPNVQKSAPGLVMRASSSSMLQMKCIDVVGRNYGSGKTRLEVLRHRSLAERVKMESLATPARTLRTPLVSGSACNLATCANGAQLDITMIVYATRLQLVTLTSKRHSQEVEYVKTGHVGVAPGRWRYR